MPDKSMRKIMKGVDDAADKMQYNQEQARKAAGYHANNPLTKEMTKATNRALRNRQLDAEYDALVGGKKGRAISKARQQREEAYDRKRLEGK